MTLMNRNDNALLASLPSRGRSLGAREYRQAFGQSRKTHLGSAGVEWVVGMTVSLCNRRHFAAQRCTGVVLIEVRKIVADKRGVGRHWRKIAGSTPGREVLSVGGVGPDGCSSIGGNKVDIGIAS